MFCFIVRKKISDSCGQGGVLSPWVEKHAETCTGCRRFLEQSRQLKKSLDSTGRPMTDLPPFLHQRVMHTLKSEQPDSSWSVLPVSSLVTVCAMAVIGISLFLPNALQDNLSQPVAEAGSGWGSLQALETGVVQAEKIISGNPDVLVHPLSTEIQYLEEDLMTVAEKLDSYLNGAVFAMISPENG